MLALALQSLYPASIVLWAFDQFAEAGGGALGPVPPGPGQLQLLCLKPYQVLGAVAHCGCLSLEQQNLRQKLLCCHLARESNTREEVGERGETKEGK